VDRVDETFLIQASSRRAKPLDFILRHFPPLRPVMLNLTANPGQKIIAGCENGNGSFHQAQAYTDRDRKTA